MKLDGKFLILMAVGFTVGFATVAAATLIPTTPPSKSATSSKPTPPSNLIVANAGALEPVRIVGTPFVLNLNPRER